MSRMPDWSAEEDLHLTLLREEGMSTPEIAECFENRSFHAIKNRIYTLRGRGGGFR